MAAKQLSKKSPAGKSRVEASANEGTISKADAVRAALAKGLATPTAGVNFIKAEFGVVMPKQQFSVYKSEFKKRALKVKLKGKAVPKSTAAPAGFLSPPPKPRTGEPDVLLAVETIKPLVQQFGAAKLKRIVELLG
jgi:hypothetical protein